MAIFKKNKKKDKVEMAEAPEEPETDEEIKHMESVSNEKQEVQFQQVPTCLSQTQVNNILLQNVMEINAKLDQALEEE